jgi:uncharacterized membrane protein YkvA (DUF1232 family)
MTKSKKSLGRFAAVRRYLKDKDASFFGKAFLLFAVVYVATPVDLVPEAFVPVLGWLDDIGVVTLALFHLGRVTKRYQEADAKLEANTIDTVGYEIA